MSTRKSSPQSRSLRPVAEALEERQLLSAVVSGTDIDGDSWTLRLTGPGTLNVADVNGNPITAANQFTPTSIATITISGTDSIASRLVGTVQKGAGGDGKVFFQVLRSTGGGELPPIDPNTPIGNKDPTTPKNGIQAINMPNFWLGDSTGVIPTPTTSLTGPSTALVGGIEILDGVSTLQFGGVDTTYTPPGGKPLNQDNQNDKFQINLGTPFILGTSIIVDKVVTDAQAGQTAPGSTTPGSPTQDTVHFNVAGRLSLFQANEIDGNTQFPPDQFTASSGATGTTPGGTFVISGTGVAPFFEGTGSTSGPLSGQIGDLRVGGNATNLTAMVFDNINAQDARISNFSVGGETSNVLVVAPNGARNLFFGKGMDQVQINAQVINSLQANRGALDSTVTTARGIGALTIGGDVVNTNVHSGYDLIGYTTAIQSTATSGTPVPTLENRFTTVTGRQLPTTVNAGHINVHVAGDVINSVFSASVEPNPSFNPLINPGTFSQPQGKVFPFGEPDNIIYPRGVINAKVEGHIDNSANPLVVAADPNQAFFAKTVNLKLGPVIPPSVPEAPYTHTAYGRGQLGIISNNGAHPAGPQALKIAAQRATAPKGKSSKRG